MEVKDTKRIAALNDLCRTAMGITGRLVQTPGICALPLRDQSAIRERVELFDAFRRAEDALKPLIMEVDVLADVDPLFANLDPHALTFDRRFSSMKRSASGLSL